MNVTMTVEDFEKLLAKHEREMLTLRCEIYTLRETISRNGMSDADIEQYAAYIEEEARQRELAEFATTNSEELDKRKKDYYTGNGTNDI